VKLKTSELTDIALDWAVTKCMHSAAANDARFLEIFKHQRGTKQAHCYSISWAEGGPIIEREVIILIHPKYDCWTAHKYDDRIEDESYTLDGPTPLVAAMRCYVASQLGDEIDVPEELMEGAT
jgi:hypothetical protein